MQIWHFDVTTIHFHLLRIMMMNHPSIKQARLVLHTGWMSGQAALTAIGTNAHLKVPLLQHFLNMAANDLEVAWFQ